MYNRVGQMTRKPMHREPGYDKSLERAAPTIPMPSRLGLYRPLTENAAMRVR